MAHVRLCTLRHFQPVYLYNYQKYRRGGFLFDTGQFVLDFYRVSLIIGRNRCPNSLVVKHVLGKDESQVRFLLRAPEFSRLL